MLRRTGPDDGERVDRLIDCAVTVGVCVLILVGFATSYRTLVDLAVSEAQYPRWLAPAVPLSFDLGIVVLSLKVAQAARQGRQAPVLRLLVAFLSIATVLVNASSAPSTTARLLHAVPPAMFVICFESVITSLRQHRHGPQDQGGRTPPGSALAEPPDSVAQQEVSLSVHLVADLLAQHPGMSGNNLREALGARGHDVSLRTAQRLLASARAAG